MFTIRNTLCVEKIKNISKRFSKDYKHNFESEYRKLNKDKNDTDNFFEIFTEIICRQEKHKDIK